MLEGKFVKFYVADSGCGIPAELKDELFDPFRQDPLVRKIDQNSIGMGLPVVKRLVNLLHGTIDIQDTPGGGTRIRFVIPIKPRHYRQEKES